MVRGGSWRTVDRSTWHQRRRIARDFLDAAEEALELAEEDGPGNPIMSQACLAAIAFADALTIRFGGIQNRGGHSELVLALKQALGNRLPAKQSRRLESIIGRKDEIQYQLQVVLLADARVYLEQVRRFRDWCEEELTRP